jgi:hypothetical protein
VAEVTLQELTITNEDENIAVEAGLGVDSAKSNFSLGKSRCFMEVKPY